LVSPAECVWDAPPGLRKTGDLSELHPDLYDFFCAILQVSSEPMAAFVREMRGIEVYPTDLADIASIFKTVNSYLELEKGTLRSPIITAEVSKLSKRAIFPIITAQNSRREYDPLK